jgi:hypothetical protein
MKFRRFRRGLYPTRSARPRAAILVYTSRAKAQGVCKSPGKSPGPLHVFHSKVQSPRASACRLVLPPAHLPLGVELRPRGLAKTPPLDAAPLDAPCAAAPLDFLRSLAAHIESYESARPVMWTNRGLKLNFPRFHRRHPS